MTCESLHKTILFSMHSHISCKFTNCHKPYSFMHKLQLNLLSQRLITTINQYRMIKYSDYGTVPKLASNINIHSHTCILGAVKNNYVLHYNLCTNKHTFETLYICI